LGADEEEPLDGHDDEAEEEEAAPSERLVSLSSESLAASLPLTSPAAEGALNCK